MLEEYGEVIDIDHKEKGLYLILKKYQNLKPESEFRCFVRNNKLVAVCQKNTYSIFESIAKEQEQILLKIQQFFTETVSTFSESANLKDYVFDIYIDIPPNRRVWLVDINPWKEFTNPLLFTFEELEQIKEDSEPELRFVESEDDIIIRDYSRYQVPEELGGEQAPEVIADMIKIMHSKDPELYQ